MFQPALYVLALRGREGAPADAEGALHALHGVMQPGAGADVFLGLFKGHYLAVGPDVGLSLDVPHPRHAAGSVFEPRLVGAVVHELHDDVHGQAEVVVDAEECARVRTGERVTQQTLRLREHAAEGRVLVRAAHDLLGGVFRQFLGGGDARRGGGREQAHAAQPLRRG